MQAEHPRRADEEDRPSGKPPGELVVSGGQGILPHQHGGGAGRVAEDHSLSFTTAIPSSSSCLGSTSDGASVIRSVAEAVLGKAITSRMVLRPARSITMRSRPRARPPWGGA